MVNKRLIEARKAKGWTQSDVASLLAVSPTTVSRWENGTQVPHTYYLQRLCQMFCLTTKELDFSFYQRKRRTFLLIGQKATPLSALLAHPEVQRGMQDAHNAHDEYLFGSDDQEMFADLQTEEDVIRFLNEELSSEGYVQCKQDVERAGKAPDPYWYYIGFALSWLDQAMSYHQQQGENR